MRHFCVPLMVAMLASGTPASAQTLRALGPAEDSRTDGGKATVVVFADGNLRGVLGDGDAAENVAGSLGVGYRNARLSAQFVINAVGQATPVRQNFGSSILAPGSGTSLNAGLLEITYDISKRIARPICGTFIARAYASVSSAEWVDTTATDTQDEQRHGVVSGGGGTGVRCEFFNGRVRQTSNDTSHVAVHLDFGLALRTIGGDIASTANDELRTGLLGSDKSLLCGLEVGLGIQFNGLKASLSLYAFPGDIPGLSGGQLVAGFSVQSAIFEGVLADVDQRPRPEEPD